MPWAPQRPCTEPGCGILTSSGRCDQHRRKAQREYNQQRGGSTKQGYGAKWQAARMRYLAVNRTCVACRNVESTVVDHIVPHRGDQKLFWDKSNWQALCKPCHDRKTATCDGRWGRGGSDL